MMDEEFDFIIEFPVTSELLICVTIKKLQFRIVYFFKSQTDL